MQNENEMKHLLSTAMLGFFALTNLALAQCAADYDFGTATLGVSPNPELGEQFDPGVVGLPYEDILHILLPQYVLDIDSTLPFNADTPLDSASLSSIVLVDLNDTLSTATLEDVGLEVICNNNGDSGNACSFLGGNQYCATISGTPTVQGDFRVDIYVNGWVTVFGFPFSQEEVFGSFVLSLGEAGCTDPTAANYNPNAVVDDGSCPAAGCAADYDFGTATLGVSPNPELGEQFDPGLVGLPYEDILHILLPQYVLDIDSTLPFNADTPLDSASLSSIVLVDLDDTLSTTTLEAVGLEVICNNNGDSGNACSFLGGNQYCATISGTPTVQGDFRVDIYVNGWVTVFGFPFSQEEVFGSFVLSLGESGCTDPAADNYNPNAVVDDGSCVTTECSGDVNGDGAVTVGDLLAILAEFGCTSECTTDLNGDGSTTVADLLLLLSVFGSTCI